MIDSQYSKLLAGVTTEISQEIIAVELCKQFGWTYYEYLNAPTWFLDTVHIRNQTEARFAKREQRKISKHTKFK